MRLFVGCAATAIYFGLLGAIVLGLLLGADCLPMPGHTCPSDHQRNVYILLTLAVGLVIYWAIGLAVERYLRRHDDDS